MIDCVRVFCSRPFYSVCSVRFDTDEFNPEDSRFGTEPAFSTKKQALTRTIKGTLPCKIARECFTQDISHDKDFFIRHLNMVEVG